MMCVAACLQIFLYSLVLQRIESMQQKWKRQESKEQAQLAHHVAGVIQDFPDGYEVVGLATGLDSVKHCM